MMAFAAILITLISSVVTAAVVVTLTREATIKIVLPQSSSNSTAISVSPVAFDLGSHSPGDSFTYRVIVENIGDATVRVYFGSDMPSSLGSLTGYISYNTTNVPQGDVLPLGTSAQFDLCFTINPNAQPGTYNFIVYINAEKIG